VGDHPGLPGQVGPLYVFDAEAEAKKKLGEVRRLSRQLKSAKLQQESLGTAQDHQALIQNLNTQIGQIKAEINGVSQQINHLPRFRNRFASTYVQQQYAELTTYRNQLNFELGQQSNWLAQLKAHPPDPKTKQELDDEVQERSVEYDQAVRDLVQMISTAKENYAALAKDGEVKKALDAPPANEHFGLGPSHEFHEIKKFVEKIEKESKDSPPAAKARTPHTPKRSTR